MLNYMVTCRNMDKKPYDNKLNSIVSEMATNISNTASSISDIANTRVVGSELLNNPQSIFMKVLKPRTGDMSIAEISNKNVTTSFFAKQEKMFEMLSGGISDMTNNTSAPTNSFIADIAKYNKITDTIGK